MEQRRRNDTFAGNGGQFSAPLRLDGAAAEKDTRTSTPRESDPHAPSPTSHLIRLRKRGEGEPAARPEGRGGGKEAGLKLRRGPARYLGRGSLRTLQHRAGPAQKGMTAVFAVLRAFQA